MIESNSCLVCGSTERTYLFEGRDRLHGLPGRFPVVRCLTCGSAYLAQRPIDLSDYYPADSYAAYYNETTNQKHYSSGPGRRFGLMQRQRLLEALKPAGGRLLDVGCGAGDFLALMQSHANWQVSGLEPSPEAARYAQAVRNLSVVTGTLPCLDMQDGAYDVITMWHTIEHVPNALEVLVEARRLLRSKGVLVVGLPVSDSLEAKWFGPNWAGYDVPRHLTTFTRASLIGLMNKSRFRAEERQGVVQGFASLRLSLSLWLNDKGGIWRKLSRFWRLLIFPLLYLYLRVRGGSRLSVAVFIAYPTE